MKRNKKPGKQLAESDRKTREYLLGLMKTLPMRLFDLVKELKENSVTINQKIKQLLKDVEGLSTRIEMLQRIVEELCDVASTGMAIGPMMKVMEDHDEEEE